MVVLGLLSSTNKGDRAVGADAFIGFFGIKIDLDPDDETILDAIEADTDSRCKSANQVGLEACPGRMTEGEDYFLYVGHCLGLIGLQHDSYVKINVDRLTEIQTIVTAKLKEAGFSETPALHFQLDSKY